MERCRPWTPRRAISFGSISVRRLRRWAAEDKRERRPDHKEVVAAAAQSANAAYSQARSKTLAIYDDMIYYTAPDSYVIAIDARTGDSFDGKRRSITRGHTSGPIIVDGKVISGGTCNGGRVNCYISAHDAKTGKELWRFYTTQAPGEPPGPDTWAGAPVERRTASTWALPGSYDPVRKLILWGIANPTPNTRAARHGGNPFAIPLTAPADLYSNSTVALDPQTGKLKWYYQHLPGDDWDEDINEERMLVRTAVNPDPKFVKWINPNIQRGQVRDISINVGEGGGIWALDRDNGQFLWAMPFPFDTSELHHFGDRRQNGHRENQRRSTRRSARRATHDLLVQHAQLVADGLSSREEFALRTVHRQLSRHDLRRSRGRRQAGHPGAPRRHASARRRSEQFEWSRESEPVHGRDSTMGARKGPHATARCWRRQAMSFSSAT